MLAFLLRMVMTAVYRIRGVFLRVARRRLDGAHGVVLTSRNEVVLVRLTYAPGWHLPGGGLKPGETPKDGLLRELREEIGLRAWGSLEKLSLGRSTASGSSMRDGLFVVRGALYQRRWSIEIAEVGAFDRCSLPADVAPWTRDVLERIEV